MLEKSRTTSAENLSMWIIWKTGRCRSLSYSPEALRWEENKTLAFQRCLCEPCSRQHSHPCADVDSQSCRTWWILKKWNWLGIRPNAPFKNFERKYGTSNLFKVKLPLKLFVFSVQNMIILVLRCTAEWRWYDKKLNQYQHSCHELAKLHR